MCVGLILADLDVSIDWNLQKQKWELETLVMSHRTAEVHLVTHHLTVDKVNIPLLQFLY
jgi:hypothetical protein